MKTKKTVLLAFAFLMSYAIGFSQTISPELKKALNRVEIAKKIATESNLPEDWQEVISELKKAESIDKQHGFTLYNLGLAYEKLKDYDNAIAYYKRFLIVDPKSAIAEEVSTNIDQLEYLKDRTKKQVKASENMMGLWKSVELNQYSGTPLWMFRIDKFNEDIRISVLPKSIKYNSRFTYPTAISLLHRNRLNFIFTTDVNLNPQEELNKLSNVLYAGDVVQSVIDPFLPSYFGAAASIISAIPTRKARNEQSAYIFNLDVSDSTKLTGKCNVKEYIAVAGQSPKTILDEIESYSFIKMQQGEYNAMKELKRKHKYINPRKGSSAFFCALFPGGGYLYNKQYGMFVGSIAAQTICWAAALDGYNYFGINPVPLGIAIGTHVLTIIHAPIVSKKINRKYGLACNGINYSNDNLCINLNPRLTPYAYSNQMNFAPGLSLSLNFK